MRARSLLALLLAAACAPADDATDLAAAAAAPQEVTFTASDFTYVGPDTIAPGMTHIQLVNNGPENHHLILARLGDGYTLDDLIKAHAANPDIEPDWLTFYGVANSVPAGGSTGATVDLPTGQYVMLCFIPSREDGVPHLAKGMVRGLVVAGDRNEAPAPVASARIEMHDFQYTLPGFTAGSHTFLMTNAGTQTHEAELVRLNDGATVEDFLAGLAPGASGPPPGEWLGGPGAISPGVENWWTVALEPGNYLVICFVPDLTTRAPHFSMGMVQPFTVSAAS